MKDELEKLLPRELEEVIKISNDLIKELGIKKSTNKSYQLEKKKILCPKCHGDKIVKNGHKNGTQKYKCKNCNTWFSATTNSALYHLSLTYKQLITLMEDMVDIKSLKKCSVDIGLSERETYNIRIKFLEIFGNIMQKNTILKEVIQADENYRRISFKGTRKEKMPRKSRKSGSQDLTSGISDEQLCIVFAVDSYDSIIAKVVSNGPASSDMLEKAIGNKIEKGSILVSDSKSSYIKFAQNNKLVLKQIPTGKHSVEEIYNLADLNGIMNEFDRFLRNFNGISSRHMQQYVNWFIYLKQMRYTVIYLKQKYEMYDYIISNESILKCRDVCITNMPFNVANLYEVDFK